MFLRTAKRDCSPTAIGTSGRARQPGLYRLPLDGSAPPHLLFPPTSSDDHYTQAEWSPDGSAIYYTHYNSTKQLIAPLTPDYDIVRMTFPDGHSEKIVEHAFWPRLSADGSKLVYVTIREGSGKNALFVASANGSNPQPVVFSGPWDSDVIDAPLFTPDGQSILFSAPAPTTAYKPNLFDLLSGVRVAHAHDVPSDWWSVPVEGGDPTRLTHLQTVNLFASLLPDHAHLVSLSGEGLFVMGLDGSGCTRICPIPGSMARSAGSLSARTSCPLKQAPIQRKFSAAGQGIASGTQNDRRSSRYNHPNKFATRGRPDERHPPVPVYRRT